MDEEYELEEEPEPEQQENPNLRKLREKAKKADQIEAELAAIKRERAFEKAGVDTEHPLAKTLIPSYTGDLSVEAVKAWLEQVGAAAVFQPKPETAPTTNGEVETPKPEPSPEELLAAQERQALASNGEPSGAAPTANPYDDGLDAFFEATQRGESRETASGAFYEKLWAAAAAGDPRVIRQRAEAVDR